MVAEAGRALVIAFNKWDLVDADRRRLLEKEIDGSCAASRGRSGQRLGKTGRAVDKLAPALRRALASWEQRVPTGGSTVADRGRPGHPAPGARRARPKILFATQAARGPAVRAFTSRRWTPRTCGSWSAGCARSSAEGIGSRCPYAPQEELAAPGAAHGVHSGRELVGAAERALRATATWTSVRVIGEHQQRADGGGEVEYEVVSGRGSRARRVPVRGPHRPSIQRSRSACDVLLDLGVGDAGRGQDAGRVAQDVGRQQSANSRASLATPTQSAAGLSVFGGSGATSSTCCVRRGRPARAR